MANLKPSTVSKREINKEARRNDIIEAGLLEFTSQGFTATRLDDVAARANVAKGTIYLYFDSKESLFEEVVRKTLFPARDEAIIEMAEFDGSAAEQLTAHIMNMYKVLHRENIPSLLAVIIGEVGRFPALSDFFFKELIEGSQELIRKIVERGVENGEFRKSALLTYTQILVAPALFSATWKFQFDQQSPIDIEVYAQTHIEFVLRGLKV